MVIHVAAVGTMFHTYNEWLSRFDKRIAELRSYWELRYFDGHTIPMYGHPFMLDSGAFSALREEVEIRPDVYAKFLERYGHQCDSYINLDAIPKGSGPQAKANSAEETLKNQKYLESLGFKPIPVFHKGEPDSYLKHYVDNYEYIAIGGLVDSQTHLEFFKHIWDKFLTKPDGTPRLKVHAFGMTTVKHMVAYPWYSVDSSTWLIQSKLGWIAIPKRGAQDWLWNETPLILAVSNETAARDQLNRHYDTINDDQRKVVDLWLEEMGLNIDYLRQHPVGRMAANLEYWCRMDHSATWKTHHFTNQFDLI